MNGVGFEILVRTPVPHLPSSYPPPPHTHTHTSFTTFAFFIILLASSGEIMSYFHLIAKETNLVCCTELPDQPSCSAYMYVVLC